MSAALHLEPTSPRGDDEWSHNALTTIWDTMRAAQLSRGESQLLMALATWCGPQGESWRSYDAMACALQTSARTLKREVARLEAKGLVEVTRRKDPTNPLRNLPNVYRVNVRALRALARPKNRWPASQLDGQPAPEGSPGGGDSRAPGDGDSRAPGGSDRASLSKTRSQENPETKPKEREESPPRLGKEGEERGPEATKLTAAWLLGRYESAYEAHYDRWPVVLPPDHHCARAVLTAANKQAQHHQRRLARDGREVPGLDELTAACVDTWLSRYLARAGRATKEHPEGFLRGGRHALRWLPGELAELGTPWDGSRALGPPAGARHATTGQEPTLDTAALDATAKARTRQRNEKLAALAAGHAAREAARVGATSQDREAQPPAPAPATEPTIHHAPAAEPLGASEPAAVSPPAEPTALASDPATDPTDGLAILELASTHVDDPASSAEVAVAGPAWQDRSALEASPDAGEEEGLVTDPATDEDPADVVADCQAWMARDEQGPRASESSPLAAAELLARLPALCACPTPAPSDRSASALGSLGVRLDQAGPRPMTPASLPVGPGLASGARPGRTVTGRARHLAQERHDDRVAWATSLWPAAAADLVRLAAAELEAARGGGQLPPQDQRRLSELCTQAARARPRRHGPR